MKKDDVYRAIRSGQLIASTMKQYFKETRKQKEGQTDLFSAAKEIFTPPKPIDK